MRMISKENELKHFGILGMKWGVRRTPAQLRSNSSDSSVTKRVKADYNNMDDKTFAKKYQTTKATYAKRVEKYGDPYMNSPLAKFGKAVQREANKNKARFVQREANKNEARLATNKKTIGRKTLEVGASVTAGLLASNVGGMAAFKLTGSVTAAKIVGPTLGIIGGKKFYDVISKD